MFRFHGSFTTSALVLVTLNAPAASQSTTRVSVSSSGAQANSVNYGPSISADARFVAFASGATTLVTGDTNGFGDVFVRSVLGQTTERVSISSSGTQANQQSGEPAISADGRYVAFFSAASNLVAGDTNLAWDVFLHDRTAHTTRRVSVGSSGVEGNGGCYQPSISADGRYVAFRSNSSNLVAGDTNGTYDVFVHDCWSLTTERVSVASNGTPAVEQSGSPWISADGRYVVFWSDDSSLVAGDANGASDVFVRDRSAGTTELVSLATGGTQGDAGSYDATISPDGRYVAFSSYATTFAAGDTLGTPDVFLRDRIARTTEGVSVPVGGRPSFLSFGPPTLSADGRFVAFWSTSPSLVAGDTNGADDIFVRDRSAQTTERVSVSTLNVQGNARSGQPSISPDGRYVAFFSEASNLVVGDTNGEWDVFLRDRGAPASPTIYCVAQANSLGCVPTVTVTGVPSASAGSGFDFGASHVRNQSAGILFFGTNGSTLVPMQSSVLCVSPPLSRTFAQSSLGSAWPIHDCSGSYHFDFNAYIAAGSHPSLTAGRQVWAQYFSRDPGLAPPNNVVTTAAVTFVIGP